MLEGAKTCVKLLSKVLKVVRLVQLTLMVKLSKYALLLNVEILKAIPLRVHAPPRAAVNSAAVYNIWFLPL